MPLIHVLDEPTINQIAAGEVVERPSAVVKELIENAMDAGATAVTAEIKEGGLSFIRVTDNGAGIAKEDIPLAFLRHATSKIKTAEDLLSVTSLGFRGEALSSIAAVAQVELITKTADSLNGYRYIIEGGEEKSIEEIGCPGGTTILVRNIFYNTPARRKFLKSAMTEAGYVSDLMERLIVSHPGISFKFIMNNQVKLQSSGNNSCKDILYHIYGRDISKELVPVEYHGSEVSVTGFIGKPVINRGNRNFENYFINGRYIKSNVITKAIEEAYKPFLMQHKYPFTSLYYKIEPSLIDVNVHPQKREIRLKTGEEIFRLTCELLRNSLSARELIPRVTLNKQEEKPEKENRFPEPFEGNRRKQLEALGILSSTNDAPKAENGFCAGPAGKSEKTDFDKTILPDINNNQADKNRKDMFLKGSNEKSGFDNMKQPEIDNNDISGFNNYTSSIIRNIDKPERYHSDKSNIQNKIITDKDFYNHMPGNSDIGDRNHADAAMLHENEDYAASGSGIGNNLAENLDKQKPEQLSLFPDPADGTDTPFLSEKALGEHRIIGQVFSTYWLVEYQKNLYIIDQHAAHEKVLYERIIAAAGDKTFESQLLMPPIVLTLTLKEQEILEQYKDTLNRLGYEFEPFGGNEYSIRAVPADLYGLSEKGLLLEFIDELTEELTGNISHPESILERIASLSCKAAVKANHTFSYEEASCLIKELLTLKNPYNCPHGRPVIISMSQYELEKKFKRVL